MREATEVGKMVGERLKELRIKRGFTQYALADDLGCHVSQISRYERGVIEMNYTVLRFMAGALLVSLDYLLGVSDEH